MNDVFFSIVTPTRDRPVMLKRAIRSVLRQSYKNFELVVVDDASDRDTFELVGTFRDERIVYVRHEENRGVAAAYNTGVKRSKGLFVSFLDDDDEYFPDFLKKAHRFIGTSSRKIDFFWTGVRHVRDMPRKEVTWFEKDWKDGFDTVEQARVAAATIGNGHGLVVKRELFDKVGMFDENLKVCEDTDFLFRLVQNCEFSVLPEVLVKIHHHRHGQLTDEKNYTLRARAVETVMDRHRSFLKRNPELWMTFARHLADLHYRSDNRRQGRSFIMEVIRRSPCTLLFWVDWICHEIHGRNAAFCFTKEGFRHMIGRFMGWDVIFERTEG